MTRSRSPAALPRSGARGDAPHRVCFLFIAQSHQVLHSLSAATELARSRPDVLVDVVATSPDVLEYARLVAELTDFAPIRWRLLGPAWLRAFQVDGLPAKLPMLLANARALGAYDVIVAPERTTAVLRAVGVRAKLIYTQHGAGDRAGPFEPRLAKFDLVFAAGAKQRDRMVADGLVAPERCAIVGYPKFDLVDRLRPQLPDLFATRRPTVLYNPHFSSKLSSWQPWGRQVLEAFAGQDRFNLIFAPHLRLFGGRSADEVPAIAPFLGLPHLHIDLGDSSAAIDMTYTRAADLYLGDVSSQVYEFLRRPRSCVFLNPRRLAWEDDESFRHWRFGPVLEDLEALLPAVAEAEAAPGRYRDEQVKSFAYTFDADAEPASRRAANAIADVLGLPALPPGTLVEARAAKGRVGSARLRA